MGTTATTIADQLAREISNGRLPPGARVPTHRDIAYRHGVSINTASHAMRLLTERGLIVGEVGRGSFVRAPGHIDVGSFPLEPADNTMIDLARNIMTMSDMPDRFESAARHVLRRNRDGLIDYQPHPGQPADRAAGALWLSGGGDLPNDPSRVVVCGGSQHALMVTLMAVTRPGDAVAVEALTWPGIKFCASALRLTLLPVPMDARGLNVRALLRLASRTRIAAVYCMPDLHNPTGTTLPAPRRESLALLARRLDFQVIEDAAYSFLPDRAPPPLAALAPERSWYLYSTSKLMMPGLRAAWLMTPPGQTERAVDAIRATVWSTPPMGPAIASQWVADGTAAAFQRAKRAELRARHAVMESIADWGAAPYHHWAMQRWVTLPRRVRGQDFMRAAAERGVRVSPAAAFGVGQAPNAVRISLGAAPSRAALRDGLQRLASLL